MAKKVIGVTGSLGTGKSTVARIFASLGAIRLDADKIARRALRKGSPAYLKIVEAFGIGVLRSSGAIDRKKLAEKAFSTKDNAARLNAMTHPYVKRVIRDKIRLTRRSKKPGHIVVDAPLLIEAGLEKDVDAIVVVTAKPSVVAARSEKRAVLSQEEIKRRTVCQLPLKQKEALADFIIDNNETKIETRKHAAKVWKEIIHGSR